MKHQNILKMFREFTKRTKDYRKLLNTTDAGMFLCDIHTFEDMVIKELNANYTHNNKNKHDCLEHGYMFPCPVCDGESDS
jgi:hypothetical protein